MTIALRPPEAPTDVASWNDLIALSGRPLPLLGSVVAAFEPAEAPDPALPRFGVAVGPLALVAAFTDYPFEALFGTPLTAADLGDLAPPLRDALLDGMLGTVAMALPDPWRNPQRVPAPAVEADDHVWFAVAVERLAPQPIRFAVGGSRARLAAVLGRLAPDSPVRRGLVAGHRILLSVDLVRLSLPRAALAGLPGRLLLLPRSVADHLQLVAGDRAVELAADPGGWRCRRIGAVAALPLDPAAARDPSARGSAAMDDTPFAPAAEEAPVLRLPVDFSIGGVEASLGDIDGWRPGSLLTLDLPLPREGLPVTIRIAGTVVGSGDLVRIDDRYAVRITTLRPA